MTIDGKHIAEEILAHLEKQYAALGRSVALGIVSGGEDAATRSYVRIKERTAARLGVKILKEELPHDADTAGALAALARIEERCDGLIVQLPLPAAIDTDEVLAAIPPERDVDGIGASPNVLSPVVGAMKEILHREHISVADKHVAVVGKGRLVGAPAAAWFEREGGLVRVIPGATYFELEDLLDADIIVLGAGSAGILKPDMIKDGVVLLDAGTSEQGGELRGDAEPACAEKAALFTPVPGGIGPVAVAMIFKNLLELART